MNIQELAEKLNLTCLAGQTGLDREIRAGYTGDLLSDVMANAPEECIWLTVQGHQNVVAVGVLKEMAAIIITGGHLPDQETREKADQEGIPLMTTKASSFDSVMALARLGIDL